VYIARGRANRGAYDYSDHNSAARVCASIPAGAVPDVLGRARDGRDSFFDCPTLATAAQRAMTLSSIALACMAGDYSDQPPRFDCCNHFAGSPASVAVISSAELHPRARAILSISTSVGMCSPRSIFPM